MQYVTKIASGLQLGSKFDFPVYFRKTDDALAITGSKKAKPEDVN